MEKHLTIGSFNVRINDDGLVSLTDIYAAAERDGLGDGKRKPSDWARESGADFIDFVAENLKVDAAHLYVSKPGKHGGGTFAHWQIALIEARTQPENKHLGVLIWSGRSLHLSSMGSGDIASKAMTATTGQSESPSARTEQLRDGNPSPKQPRETLADQNSNSTIDDSEFRHNIADERGTRQSCTLFQYPLR